MWEVPEGWRWVALGEVVSIQYGKALKEADRDGKGTCPVCGSSGVVGRHSSHIVDHPTIVIGRKGSVGQATFVDAPSWPIDTTFYVTSVDPGVLDLRFLYWWLERVPLGALSITTSIPGLNRNTLRRSSVPLPPLPEQRRIAAILDKADEVRRKQREASLALRRTEDTGYQRIVGPDAPGYATWPETTIEELAADAQGSLRTGPFGSALRHSEFVDEGVAVLGIDNAVQNRFQWGERRFITRDKYEQLERYTVRPGDVIITIMGTTGRSAVVPPEIPTAISTKHLATITVDRDKAHPTYAAHAVRLDPCALGQIRARTRGAIMAGLNLTIIRELRLRVPPLSVQQRYADWVTAFDESCDRGFAAERECGRLFSSLSQRAFRGQL